MAEQVRLYTKEITSCNSCPDYVEGGNRIFGGIERPYCSRGEGRYLRKEDGDYKGDYPSWCELKAIHPKVNPMTDYFPLQNPPPNCHTCNNYGYETCPFFPEEPTFPERTGSVACIHHPHAREWLNRDVIAEFERRIGRLGTYPDNTQAIRAYTNAIALMKNGVKK